jgi:hypothetical protein
VAAQQLQAQGAVAAAQQRAAGTVTAAGTAADARLAATERAAQAAQELEFTRQLGPTGQNAASQSNLRQLQLQLALDALGQDDPAAAAAIATGAAPQQADPALDITQIPRGKFVNGRFVPYTAAEQAAVNAAYGVTPGR